MYPLAHCKSCSFSLSRRDFQADIQIRLEAFCQGSPQKHPSEAQKTTSDGNMESCS